MPDAPTPEMLKRMKLGVQHSSQDTPPVQSNGSGTVPAKTKSRTVTVEDDPMDEDGGESSSVSVAEFAPGNDADYFAEEDDEGRFFGGGLTEEQKTILNIFEKSGGEGVQEDVSCVKCGLAFLTTLRLDIPSPLA